ncbi:hypothetical protein [Kitasatospora sp. NPDC085464]
MAGEPRESEAGDEPVRPKRDDQRERRVQMVGVIVIEVLRLAAEIFRWL